MGARLRRLLPWLVGAAILLALVYRVPAAALRGGLAHGPWGLLAAYTLPFILITLAADAYATGVCLRIAGEPRPFGTLILVRGATYLLGLLNYALGQGRPASSPPAPPISGSSPCVLPSWRGGRCWRLSLQPVPSGTSPLSPGGCPTSSC